jgi:hypothetical protein
MYLVAFQVCVYSCLEMWMLLMAVGSGTVLRQIPDMNFILQTFWTDTSVWILWMQLILFSLLQRLYWFVLILTAVRFKLGNCTCSFVHICYESQIIICSDLSWPLKIWGVRMSREFWEELTVPAVRGNIYLSWWYSSVSVVNVVSFTCADKQNTCSSSVSSNALSMMMYELLNPMFCVSLCLQLLMLHTNYVLKICWGPVPNRSTYEWVLTQCHRYSTCQIRVLIKNKIVLRFAEFQWKLNVLSVLKMLWK